MNKIELYDTVELLETLIEGKDFISSSKQDIEKGAIGTVIEFIDETFVLVEFSYKEYSNPVVAVPLSILKKTD